MESVKLNIFGFKLSIQPKAQVVTIEKLDEDFVCLKSFDQSGRIFTTPINVKDEYNKTSDDFLQEWHKQNAIETSNEVNF